MRAIHGDGNSGGPEFTEATSGSFSEIILMRVGNYFNTNRNIYTFQIGFKSNSETTE